MGEVIGKKVLSSKRINKMDIKQEKSIVGYKKKNKAWRVKEKEGLIILRMIIKFLALY